MAEVGTKTGSKTQAGRDVYKTPEGEMVSEKSTTFEYKGKWINVPTIHKGYLYDEDVLRMMLDAEVIEPTSVHTNKKDAIKAARERSKNLKFNEGGLADYRTRLVDMTDEERAEVAPGSSAYGNFLGKTGDKKPLSVQMAKTGLDVVTPIGTIKDIQDELSKKDPSYPLIAGMAGLELLGPAAGAIKMAAKSGNKSVIQRILDSFKSKPAPRFEESALKTAANQNDLSREILVEMPIDDFLAAAKKEVSPEKLEKTRRLVSEGTPFETVPSLQFKNNGDGTAKVIGHDGRHRAMALKEQGETTIPVRLQSSSGDGPSIRWGQQSNSNSSDYVDTLPKQLVEEDGEALINMPDTGINRKDVVTEAESNILGVSKNKPEEFSGTIKLQHGYQGEAPKEFSSRGKYKGFRYDTDGGNFGDKPLYLEDPDNPFFLNKDRIVEFSKDGVVDVDATFDKAFVLTPDTLPKLKEKVGDLDLLDATSGPLVVDRLEELGYDGLIIKGFPNPSDTELTAVQKQMTNALQGLKNTPEDFARGQKIVEKYQPRLRAAEETAGIVEDLQQPQILAFRPERQNISSAKKAPADLGFNEDVYHYTTSETIEGDKFNPDKAIGNWNKLGVHVGGQKASRDRFTGINDPERYPDNVQGSTLPLKARTNKPLMFSDEVESEYSVQSKLREMAEARGLDPTNYAADLRKQLAEEGYTHIPYINEVEAEGTVSYIMLVDRPEGSDAVLRSKFAEFDPSKKDKPELGLAQGGVVNDMDKQMKMFAVGGIADDGLSRDPVSGNEIPPGSLAEEVRDDIPAQLSEGEYVVPADVVRFFGVKFFEDLRTEAKMGLSNMEANGRIGGEPVDMPMAQASNPNEITEEDLAQLEQMLSTGVANGGLMDKIAIAAKTDKVINDRMNANGMVVGYAAGGEVTAPTASYADPTRVDAVINQVMTTLQQKPELIQELSKRGIQISRTNPSMEAGQMDQANPPAETRKAFALGGMPTVPGYGMDTSYMTPTGLPSWAAVPGSSYTYQGPGVPPAPDAIPAATTTGEAAVAGPSSTEESCKAMGMGYDPVTQTCILVDSGDSGPVTAPEPAEFKWEEPEVDYFNMSEEELAAIGTGAKIDPFLNKLTLGAAAVAGPLGLLVGGYNAYQQGKAISEVRSAALVAKARGFDDLADTLSKQADDLVGKSSFLVQGANYFNVLSGGNVFAQQVKFKMPKGMEFDPSELGLTENQQIRVLEASSPPGMVYQPETKSYVKDDNDSSPPGGGGTFVETSSGGTPIYTPTATTVRPRARPSGGGNNNSSSSTTTTTTKTPVKSSPTAGYDSKKDTNVSNSSSSGSSTSTSSSGSSNSYGVGTYNPSTGSGGFNKGGLMKKRKKK